MEPVHLSLEEDNYHNFQGEGLARVNVEELVDLSNNIWQPIGKKARVNVREEGN